MILVVVSVLAIVEGIAYSHFYEGDKSYNPDIGDSVYFVLVNVFGETTNPTSIGGRILTLIALLQGLIIATYLVTIAAFFTIRGGRVMNRSHKDHFLICGWNFQGPRIIRELLNARSDDNFDVVVVPGEEIPEKLKEFGNKIFVVEGTTTEDKTLIEAGIGSARSAIILTDTNLMPDNADAKSLMITLAVETINPDVYTCVQLQNSDNAIHLKRANVDELVLFDVIGANLSVASALNPGITRMVSELIHFDDGSELWKLSPPLPKDVVGTDFKEASRWFLGKDIILIGVESDELKDSYFDHIQGGELTQKPGHRGVFVNPKKYQIQNNDALFVISDEAPATML